MLWAFGCPPRPRPTILPSLSRVKRLLVTDCVFFVTVNVRKDRPAFTGDEYPLMIAALQESRCKLAFRLCGYVLMPDHWHALINKVALGDPRSEWPHSNSRRDVLNSRSVPLHRQAVFAKCVGEEGGETGRLGEVVGKAPHDLDRVGRASHLAAGRAEIDEPVAKDRLRHCLQRLIHPPIQLDLVVEHSQD